MSKKIGILGGTFDPIHNGHIYIAYEAKRLLDLDEVIFMPSGSPPHKDEKNVTDSHLRYEMVDSAIRCYDGFVTSDYEVNKQGLSYTYETLMHFKDTLKEAELYFITGADCLIDLEKWKSVDLIMDNCNFVVFNRPGYTKEELYDEKRLVEQKYNKEIIFLDLLQLDISSTWIRQRIRDGYMVDFFIPDEVSKIIRENRLYL
ncbi:nicotinate-nucleotide adenylyltransferase [Clostridium sp. YIM B02505]|uniref:Probable nicotinate-nucleotide adenylyltransferase n=1 Tax=Clostridium yunnanense TaxID=2800325 RepID=A0ABS1EPM6_9CLOT|nr:nicotinate-nucleotide adenylyltransferase [Clostridium yunnanense]MBK1811336.1 nicotinate-nucleotide adenylyltransferase [Clostridium yunnanense]